MRIILKEIFRSSFRRKWLSIGLIFSVALSVSIIVTVYSIDASIKATLSYSSNEFNESNLLVWTNNRKHPFNSSVIEELMSINGIEDVELKIREFGGILANNSASHAIFIGIPIKPHINKLLVTEETWNKFHGNVCIVDRDIAEDLGIHIGDNITAMFYGVVVSLKVIAFTDTPWVVASGSPITLAVFIPLKQMQELSHIEGFTHAEIIASRNLDLENILHKVLNRLNSSGFSDLDGYVVRKTDITNISSAIINLFFVLTFPIVLIAFIIGFIATFSSILNEMREIGVKKAIGYTEYQIFVGYLLRNLFLSVIGIIIGIAVGYYLASYTTQLIVLSQLGAVRFIFPLSGLEISIILILGTVVTATIIPSLKVRTVSVITVMRVGFEEFGKTSSTISKSKYRMSKLPLTLLMAWRDIKRRRKRSALIVIGIMLTAVSVTSFFNVSQNFVLTYKDAINQSFGWDIAFGSMELFNATHISAVKSLENIFVVEPQIWFWIRKNTLVLRFNNETINRSMVIGDLMVTGIPDNAQLFNPVLFAGTKNIKPGEVIISVKASKENHIKLGDKIYVEGTAFGRHFNRTLIVAGIAQLSVASGWSLVVNIKDAQAMMNWSNSFNFIAIRKISPHLNDIQVAKTVVNKLLEYGKHVDGVFVRKSLTEQVLSIVELTEAYTNIASIVFLITTIIGLIGAITILLMEQQREMFLLVTIGVTPMKIAKIFLSEALILGIFSAILGSVIFPMILFVFSLFINSPIFPIWVTLTLRPIDFIQLTLVSLSIIASLYFTFSFVKARRVRVETLKKEL